MRKKLGTGAEIPLAWQALLQVVEASYEQFDADRRLVECAMKVSSGELMSANESLRRQNENNQALLERLKSVVRSLQSVEHEHGPDWRAI